MPERRKRQRSSRTDAQKEERRAKNRAAQQKSRAKKEKKYRDLRDKLIPSLEQQCRDLEKFLSPEEIAQMNERLRAQKTSALPPPIEVSTAASRSRDKRIKQEADHAADALSVEELLQKVSSLQVDGAGVQKALEMNHMFKKHLRELEQAVQELQQQVDLQQSGDSVPPPVPPPPVLGNLPPAVAAPAPAPSPAMKPGAGASAPPAGCMMPGLPPMTMPFPMGMPPRQSSWGMAPPPSPWVMQSMTMSMAPPMPGPMGMPFPPPAATPSVDPQFPGSGRC